MRSEIETKPNEMKRNEIETKMHVFNLKGGWETCHFFHQISIKFSYSEAGKKKVIIQKQLFFLVIWLGIC